MSRSEEKERSAVEVVKGNVKYSFKSPEASLCILDFHSLHLQLFIHWKPSLYPSNLF